MQASVILVWVGAFLVVASVLYTAARALGKGRLSEARPSPPGSAPGTLEPRGRSGGPSLKGFGPGLVLAGLGALCLLAGAFL